VTTESIRIGTVRSVPRLLVRPAVSLS